MSERTPKEVVYTDPQGKKVKGWYLDGHVYQDEAATVPIASGSSFRTGSGKVYRMTDYGGILWSVPSAQQDDGSWNPLGDHWYRTARDLTQQLADRPAFSYDPENDPLWQGVKASWLQGARRSMSDTLGRASALTGGYASSYAQSTAQQSYDQQLFRLAELLPDYYDRARSAYDKQGKALEDAVGQALGIYDQDYRAWLNQQQQARWEREQTADEAAQAAKLDQWEREFAADNDRWAAEFAQELAKWEQQLADKQQSRSASAAKEERSYAYRMAMLALQQGLTVSDALLQTAGIDKTYAEALRRYYYSRRK